MWKSFSKKVKEYHDISIMQNMYIFLVYEYLILYYLFEFFKY